MFGITPLSKYRLLKPKSPDYVLIFFLSVQDVKVESVMSFLSFQHKVALIIQRSPDAPWEILSGVPVNIIVVLQGGAMFLPNRRQENS